MTNAYSIRVRGIVQGVGFRPFVYRLARAHALGGWVLNGEQGVEIHVEGEEAALRAFVVEVKSEAPPAAQVVSVEANPAEVAGFRDFSIRGSERRDRPTVRISPDTDTSATGATSAVGITDIVKPWLSRTLSPYLPGSSPSNVPCPSRKAMRL